MNIHRFLSYVLIFMLGMFVAYLGFHFNDWKYWTLMVLIVLHGLFCRLDALQEKAE